MGQLLVTALGVMLLMTAEASFALAMGAVGVMTMGHGPRTRPGPLHPQPSGRNRLLPGQCHRRPAGLGPVGLRSDLHLRLRFRGRRPHHRQGHGRHPHRPETRRKENSPSHRTSSSQSPSPTFSRITSSTHEPCKEERKSQVGDDTL